KLISNLTGNQVTPEIATAQYWCRHILMPVNFARSMETLASLGYEAMIEIGAKPTLLSMGRHCLADLEKEQDMQWLPSLRPKRSDWQQLLESLAQLYVSGVEIDWSGFDGDYPRHRIPLPTYPFQRQRYWFAEGASNPQSIPLRSPSTRFSDRLHPLLGQRLNSALAEIQFESQISRDTATYLKDHQIYQTAIAPATAYVEMALAAGKTVLKTDNLILEDLSIQQALPLLEAEIKTIQTILTPEVGTAYSFQVVSQALDSTKSEPVWISHASGKIVVDKVGSTSQTDLAVLQAEYSEPVSIANHYRQFQSRGMEYGSNFQAITQLWKRSDNTALGRVQLPQDLVLEAEEYQLHPVLLDASFQVLGAVFLDEESTDAYLPIKLKRLTVYSRPTAEVSSLVRIQPVKGKNKKSISADLCLYDAVGKIVAVVEGLLLRRVTRVALQRIIPSAKQADAEKLFYKTAWRPKPLSSQPQGLTKPGSWLLLVNSPKIGADLVQQLEAQGDRCIVVIPGNKYQAKDNRNYQVNPTQLEDFKLLLQESLSKQLPLKGIVHLWSWNNHAPDKLSLEAIQQAQVNGCGSILHLVQAIAQVGLSPLPRLWLVISGSQAVAENDSLQIQHAPLWGLGQTINLEHPDLQCTCLDLDPTADKNSFRQLAEELRFPTAEKQIAYRQGMRHVARLVRDRDKQNAAIGQQPEIFQVKTTQSGILENLTLQPLERRQPKPGEVEIQVRAAGLNFRDVLNALGMLAEYAAELGIDATTDMPFGGECAGIITAVGEGVKNLQVGDEVIAALAIGSLSSFVTVKADFVILKPQALSFEAAATISTTFLTAYYGLHYRAQIKPRDKVLIHSAAGGVGQAAVQLAQQAGAEVFATASSGKWDWLKSMGVQQVMNSRTLDFAEEILNLTQGQGVDIVLNSLNGEFIPKSLDTLSQDGRFIEIGKLGVWSAKQVAAKRADVSYTLFDLLEVAEQNPSLIAQMLTELIQQFQQGVLQPLPHKVFPIDRVVDAFRYMAGAKHIGKVVVSLPVATDRELSIDPQGSYLITGGLGALGLKVANWLVEQGAKNLILLGRSQAKLEAQQQINQLEQQGVSVNAIQVDITDYQALENALTNLPISQSPCLPVPLSPSPLVSPSQIKGVIHAAGVLDDGVLQQLSWQQFTKVMAPKVAGAWNLHTLTQEYPLDFFVCFSSIASLMGSPGQGNYGTANAFLDALSHYRHSRGLPGLSINWGPWADIGMAAKTANRDRSRWSTQGIKPIMPNRGLQILGELLPSDLPQMGVMSIDWTKFLGQLPTEAISPWFENLYDASKSDSKTEPAFLQQLETVSTSERWHLLREHIRAQLSKVLGLNSPEQIDLQQGFAELGMDSLMAVELRNCLQDSLACSIPSTLAFDYPNVEALVNYIALELLSFEPTESFAPHSPPLTEPEPSTNMEELSQAEIAELLAQELTAILEEQVR
ncbi:MAG: SDR family NAD(P)-dependent oxidoreductase, partial [Waterburya sp.]